MNTQNLKTLFPTVTKQKILNLSYGEGEHYTVLPMIAQKEDTFYLWEISAMSEQEYEHRNGTYKEAKTNRAGRSRPGVDRKNCKRWLLF